MIEDFHKCYDYPGMSTTFNDASKHCSDKGSMIAIPVSEVENVFQKNSVRRKLFIGLTAKAVEGEFVSLQQLTLPRTEQLDRRGLHRDDKRRSLERTHL